MRSFHDMRLQLHDIKNLMRTTEDESLREHLAAAGLKITKEFLLKSAYPVTQELNEDARRPNYKCECGYKKTMYKQHRDTGVYFFYVCRRCENSRRRLSYHNDLRGSNYIERFMMDMKRKENIQMSGYHHSSPGMGIGKQEEG